MTITGALGSPRANTDCRAPSNFRPQPSKAAMAAASASRLSHPAASARASATAAEMSGPWTTAGAGRPALGVAARSARAAVLGTACGAGLGARAGSASRLTGAPS